MGDRQTMGARQSLCGITRLQEGVDRKPGTMLGSVLRQGPWLGSPVPGGHVHLLHAPFSLSDPWTHSTASSAPLSLPPISLSLNY